MSTASDRNMEKFVLGTKWSFRLYLFIQDFTTQPASLISMKDYFSNYWNCYIEQGTGYPVFSQHMSGKEFNFTIDSDANSTTYVIKEK
jgi:hypothetical protein